MVSKNEASELVDEYVATFAEAECAGLHDFANLKVKEKGIGGWW